jgi:GAF domain-containing protein/HAMP domain-containing protein
MSVSPHSTIPKNTWQRMDALSLRHKLYIGLGVLIIALLLVGGIATYSNISTQRLQSDTLTRQRRMADLAATLNNNLLNAQNQAFEFFETWSLTGFEHKVSSGGFDYAREIHLDPIQQQLERIRNDIAAMRQLDPDLKTSSRLDKIATNVDAYETTLLAMAGHMQSLGFKDTGEFGELQKIMGDLQDRLADPDLASLEATLLQIDRNAKRFFLHSELPYVRHTQESIQQLIGQVDAADDALIAPPTQAELNYLAERYFDHFLAASSQYRGLQESRANLVGQSNLTTTLAQQLLDAQQADFVASVDELQRQQARTVTTTFGLALFVLLSSSVIAFAFSRQVIAPVETLGEAAEKLGKGDLSVRAPIRGGDEIGRAGAAVNMIADQLQELSGSMEQRIVERTRELEATTAELVAHSAELEEAHQSQIQVNRQLQQAARQGQRRARLLQANTEVSRAAAKIRDTDQLLHLVTELISQHFGFYHVGVFLIDRAGRDAVLRAAASDGGRRMLARQHRLRIGSEGIVGYVTATGRPRIALDVGADAVYFDNPDLPETRSEMAVPLRIGDEIIGALDVQSVDEAAFDQEDVNALTSLADQIAIAIQNARLFQQSQAALEEAERAQQLYVRQQWNQFTIERPALAYEYTLTGVPVTGDAPLNVATQAWQEGRLILSDGDGGDRSPVDGVLLHGATGEDYDLPQTHAALAVPIQIRGETIGVLDLQETEEDHFWTDDEIALIQAVADQLGQALESARLFEQTQASLAETQALFQTSRSLAAAQQIEDIWQAVVESARQRRADACGLFLFDTQQWETAQELVLVTGWDREQPPRLRAGHRVSVSGSRLFDNLGLDRPFAVTDLTGANQIDEDTRELLEMLGFSAALFQPIAVRGRWFGVLITLYQSAHTFTSAETDFYRTLADQAAVAFDGQRLLLETQRRAEREQLIRQITDRVRATSNLETILQTTVQELSKAMGLPRAFVRLGTEEELLAILQPQRSSNHGTPRETGTAGD